MNDERQRFNELLRLWGACCVLLVFMGVQSCATRDQADSVITEVGETKAWYCGPGLMGIRAVARFVIGAVTGASIPDVCKAIDVIITEDK